MMSNHHMVVDDDGLADSWPLDMEAHSTSGMEAQQERKIAFSNSNSDIDLTAYIGGASEKSRSKEQSTFTGPMFGTMPSQPQNPLSSREPFAQPSPAGAGSNQQRSFPAQPPISSSPFFASAPSAVSSGELLSPPSPLRRGNDPLTVKTEAAPVDQAAGGLLPTDFSSSTGGSGSGSSGFSSGDPRMARSVPSSPRHRKKMKKPRRGTKKTHVMEEYRRRARIRDSFAALRLVSECPKKDRFNILQASIAALKSLRARVNELDGQVREIGGGPHVAVLPESAPSLTDMTGTGGPTAVRYQVPMAITTLDGFFKSVNDPFCSLTGFERAELLTKSLFSITNESTLNEACALMQVLLEQQSTTYENAFQLVRRTGELVHVHIIAAGVSEIRGSQEVLTHYALFAAPKPDVAHEHAHITVTAPAPTPPFRPASNLPTAQDAALGLLAQQQNARVLEAQRARMQATAPQQQRQEPAGLSQQLLQLQTMQQMQVQEQRRHSPGSQQRGVS